MRARGFSLVEAMVAASVLATGLVAVVGSFRGMQRLELLARRTSQATEAAASRMAVLRIAVCDGAGAGSATAGAIAERWDVAPGSSVRSVSATVEFAIADRVHSARYDLLVRCAP